MSEYEIIVNNARDSDDISEIITSSGYTEIRKRTNIMESRYLTISKATGNFVLILDDTRYIDKTSLNRLIGGLADYNGKIGVIKEYQTGDGYYDKITRKQNLRLCNYVLRLNPINIRFILPRLYESTLAKRALFKIREKLPEHIFANLKALDLELIYLESYSEFQKVDVFQDVTIYHLPTGGVIGETKKFFKYGYSTRALRNSGSFEEISNLRGRFRRPTNIVEALEISFITLSRGVPFGLGYIYKFLHQDNFYEDK